GARRSTARDSTARGRGQGPGEGEGEAEGGAVGGSVRRGLPALRRKPYALRPGGGSHQADPHRHSPPVP
ncbi:hypothetical protein, partial [Streptomyces sp. SID161]|uniref:hypothetical protein n=1 Tax=Streptomyces sp. SID161 TaxID=2690251 RepID=UPI001F180B33